MSGFRTIHIPLIILAIMQAASGFLLNHHQTRQSGATTAPPLHVRHAVVEEKKDDDGTYSTTATWEASSSSLPSLSMRPRMIVFDKDGTLGNDAASLKRWTNHMTDCFSQALSEELSKPMDEIQQDVRSFHHAIGWDASVQHVVPSAPLAAGTWEEAVEIASTIFQQCGLVSDPHAASKWHATLPNLHGADPPIIPNLATMIQYCRTDLGLQVAVCTSDDREPTDKSLRNWNITELIDYTICGDEVMEAKPSALPLEMLCEQASLSPQECIVVGDTTGDTGMARNAHAGLCIGVLSGSGTADQLLDNGAHVVIPTVGEIPALLSSMMGLTTTTNKQGEEEVPALILDHRGIMNVPC